MSSSTPAEVLTLELCPVADLARSLKRTGQYRPILRNGTPLLLEG